jgi:fluoroacetyl-CoA thioesterase
VCHAMIEDNWDSFKFDLRRSEPMDFNIPLNISSTQSLIVEQEHTAKILGSGQVEVLATPMMIALMESAALITAQVYLPQDWTTVGTKVEIEHLRPTPLGKRISAKATLVKIDGRRLQFQIEARDNHGLIGQGSHERVVIQIEKFMSKVDALK